MNNPDFKVEKIESHIQQIMHDLKNGVMAIDRQGQVLYANPQMARYFEKDELAGETVHSLMLENGNAANDAFWDTILDVTYQQAIHHQKKVRFVSPSGAEKSFHVTSSYLRGGEDGSANGIVLTVADETEYDTLVRKKHDTTIVLIGMLLMVCMTVLITELHVFLNGAFPYQWIARSTEYGGIVCLWIMLKYTSLTVKDFGIIPTNFKKELSESLLVVAVMWLTLSATKAALMAGGSTLFPTDRPFFDFAAPPPAFYFKYMLIAFAQELVTKCGVQKSITRILEGKHRDAIAIFVTTSMFMALHVQHGFVFMLGAGVLAAVLAVLYSRYNSLLGTWLVHYSFGIMGYILHWVH